MTTVRTRFAPSPTGYLHIGGVRTALFTWMWARKHGGQFILRIEDTDQKRFKADSLDDVMTSLRWLGLDWDEGPEVGGSVGPYFQSERTELYQKWANWLLENGHAYKDFTTEEELAELRAYQEANGLSYGYDRRHRDLTPEQVAEYEAKGIPYTIRFRMPLEGETTFYDEIRGDITFDNSQVQDNVLLKSDGFPTYHLANVVDDHHMNITHIMRGEEWISTAPLHFNLYKAFGWEMPKIAHLPVILKKEGKGKMSKRDKGALMKDYIADGYLPDATRNYLTNIGWSFGDDVEKFTTAEALQRFELSDINPSPSRLPLDKLDWLNGQYIQEMDVDALTAAIQPYATQVVPDISAGTLKTLAPALSKRLKTFADILPKEGGPSPLTFLIDEQWNPDREKLQHKKMGAESALKAFESAYDWMASSEYDLESLSVKLAEIGESVTDNGKAGPFLGTLRYGMTGQKVSPPLFESIMALGRPVALDRLQKLIEMAKGAG